MGAGLERVLLQPFADVVPQLFRHSRRGARLAERLIADRPLLSTSSALAELGGQVQDPQRARAWTPGRSPVASGIPRILIDKLAYALHRFVDVNGEGASSNHLAFGEGIAPGPVAAELKGVLEAVLDLRRRLGGDSGVVTLAARKRARVTLDEGPPPGFFFTEDSAPVPAGMLLSLEDVDARRPLAFVGVRGPLGSIETQRYALERVLDIVQEPLFDEGPRLQRLAGGRFGALLAALDELVVVDEDEPRLCWRIVNTNGGLSLRPVARGTGVPLLEEPSSKLAGKKLEETVRTLPFSTAQDLEIARIFLLRCERLDGVVAERLVDHPWLELADGRPARALHARPVVVVKGDRTLEFQAAGRPLDAALLGEDGAGVVVDGDQARVLAVPVTPAQRALARAVARLGSTPLPQGVLDDVISRLKRGKLEVLLPTSLRGDRVPPSSQLVVRVAWASSKARAEQRAHGGARFSVVARPVVGGPTFVPGHGPPIVFGDVSARALWCERDLAAEDAAAHALLEAIGVDDDDVEGPFRFSLLSPARTCAALALLSDRSDVVLALAVDGPRVSSATTQQLRVRLGKRTDWLGLDGEVALDDGTRLSLQSLLEALREGRRYVVVDQGRIVALAQELATPLGSVAGFTAQGALPAGSVAVVDEAMLALAAAGASVSVDAGWEHARIDLAAARDVDGAAPAGISATLRPYQEEGLRFLRRLSCWGTGAVLADDMGLGKTLVTTCLLVDRAARGPALVVAPTSLGFHWAAELARFAPGLRGCLYEGDVKKRAALIEAAGPNDVVIASYGLVQRDVERFAARPFSTLVIDEAQAVKNASTGRAQALRQVPADFRVALTGTPIENHTGELWSIFDLTSPGLFGSFTQWKARWATPIEKDDDVKRRQLLARTIRPFLLRRKKSEVAQDLPEKTVVTRVLALSPEEHHAYERLRLALIADIERGDDEVRLDAAERRVQILAALTRLRLCACHPVFAADVVDEGQVPIGTKQRVLVELVDELRAAGHKCLVFSQFVRHLTLARRFLDESGAQTLLLTGQTPAADRRDLVEQFQKGDADVFLISLRAGGFGLNLTRASYVVHLDPWWNPAVEAQASDRAHRIGQTLPVTVVRLVAGATLEEPILDLHERKRALADGILEGSDVASKLELDELLSLVRTSRRFDGSLGQELRANDVDDG